MWSCLASALFVRRNLGAAVALAFLLAACTAHLAPAYDASIVAGIDAANEEAMRLFASVSTGASPATYPRRADDYNTVIGKLEALRISAASRPAASGALFLRQNGAGQIPTLQSPTPDILAAARQPIETMRDTDRARGLTPTLVEGFKQSFEISMQQALTYEKALRR